MNVSSGKIKRQSPQVHGVTDCETSVHRYQRQPLRMTPLGYDRHGRRYWFAVRRIFVLVLLPFWEKCVVKNVPCDFISLLSVAFSSVAPFYYTVII